MTIAMQVTMSPTNTGSNSKQGNERDRLELLLKENVVKSNKGSEKRNSKQEESEKSNQGRRKGSKMRSVR